MKSNMRTYQEVIESPGTTPTLGNTSSATISNVPPPLQLPPVQSQRRLQDMFLEELQSRLNELKKEIDEDPEEWETRKRQINPYESIFSCGNRSSVSKIQPISRAFFKMIEISNGFKKLYKEPIRVLHLAESPGGFVQAWDWMRKSCGIVDDITAISLQKSNTDLPWKRLQELTRTWARKPHMLTGDLLSPRCRENLIQDYSIEKAHLITGDGGFDFSIDYCRQEEQATHLILAEFIVGLQCIAEGGSLVLKVFDVFTLPMRQILWVCYNKFDSFRLVKPRTSRACNSEKYIVATGFRGVCENLEGFLARCEKILCDSAHIWSRKTDITTLFPQGPNASWETMTPAFKKGYESVVRDLTLRQIYWLEKALKTEVILTGPNPALNLHYSAEDIRLAVEWCREFDVPINSSYYSSYHRSWNRETDPRESTPPASPPLHPEPHCGLPEVSDEPSHSS